MEPINRANKVLRTLDDLQSKHEITIIKLSEPISSSTEASQQNQASVDPSARTSDVSNASLDHPTPTSLEADLAHYCELFSKLRFSYVEQVTKEKFIRAIVGDPPEIVSARENVDLEAQNATAKAALKQLKADVAEMITTLEARGKELVARHERVSLETRALRDLPGKISGLEEAIRGLKEGSDNTDATSNANLPLAKTEALVEERKARLAELDKQLDQLASVVPRKRNEVERLTVELGPLEMRKQTSMTAAREAKRRKEAAAGGDDLEERGRWWRASEAALRTMLDLKE